MRTKRCCDLILYSASFGINEKTRNKPGLRFTCCPEWRIAPFVAGRRSGHDRIGAGSGNPAACTESDSWRRLRLEVRTTTLEAPITPMRLGQRLGVVEAQRVAFGARMLDWPAVMFLQVLAFVAIPGDGLGGHGLARMAVAHSSLVGCVLRPSFRTTIRRPDWCLHVWLMRSP